MRKITNEELGRPTAGEFAAMAKMPVTVVLDNVRSLQNVGAFFRTGDAFAVEHIALCGITAVPPNRDIHKTQTRANALKNIMIPRYTRIIAEVSDAIEEKERGEFSRLKAIKRIVENK